MKRLRGPLRAAFRGAILVACGWLFASCDSPTLPLPPPADPVQSADADPGYVRLDGIVYPMAIVLIYNESTSVGVIATADGTGAYHTRLPVDFQTYPDGNAAEIWMRIGIDESPLKLFTIRPPAQ